MKRHLLYLLYVSGCEHSMSMSLCVCSSEFHTQWTSLRIWNTDNMCGVCVRRTCLYMTLACSNLDLWCSVFFAVLYVCEWVFRGEKDAFRYPAAHTYAWKQGPGPLGRAAARMIEWHMAPPWCIYWKKECIEGCLNVNKYRDAFGQEKLQGRLK